MVLPRRSVFYLFVFLNVFFAVAADNLVVSYYHQEESDSVDGVLRGVDPLTDGREVDVFGYRFEHLVEFAPSTEGKEDGGKRAGRRFIENDEEEASGNDFDFYDFELVDEDEDYQDELFDYLLELEEQIKKEEEEQRRQDVEAATIATTTAATGTNDVITSSSARISTMSTTGTITTTTQATKKRLSLSDLTRDIFEAASDSDLSRMAEEHRGPLGQMDPALFRDLVRAIPVEAAARLVSRSGVYRSMGAGLAVEVFQYEALLRRWSPKAAARTVRRLTGAEAKLMIEDEILINIGRSGQDGAFKELLRSAPEEVIGAVISSAEVLGALSDEQVVAMLGSEALEAGTTPASLLVLVNSRPRAATRAPWRAVGLFLRTPGLLSGLSAKAQKILSGSEEFKASMETAIRKAAQRLNLN